MTKNNLFYISVLVLILSTACKKPTPPEPPAQPVVPLNTLTCKINGIPWSPGKDTLGNLMLEAYIARITNDSMTPGFFIEAYKGQGYNKERISLHIKWEDVSFPLGLYSRPILFLYMDPQYKSNWYYYNGDDNAGGITIKGFDSNNFTVFGDFNFKSTDNNGKNIYTITDGHFNLKYEVR